MLRWLFGLVFLNVLDSVVNAVYCMLLHPYYIHVTS